MSVILITGVAGFIGSHVAEKILKRGDTVVGIDNFDSFYKRELKESNLRELTSTHPSTFHFFETDIRELSPDKLASFDIDTVIHLAAKAGVRSSLENPEEYESVNVFGTLKVLEFCKKRNIKRLIYSSSSSVYGNSSALAFKEDQDADRPISPYAASKRAAELYCANYSYLYGISIAVLRFFTVYGPRQRPDMAIHKFAKLILDSQPITLFQSDNSDRDYTFIEDITEGVTKAFEWLKVVPSGSFEVFNLGSACKIRLKEVIALLETSLKAQAQIVESTAQPGDVKSTLADISKSSAILGYRPKISMELGIKEFVSWLRKQA